MAKDNSGESLPISRLFPNVVTLIGLCFGLFALKYAIAEKWETAVIFIFIAAIIDGMDGRLARLLNASSNFGAQLDSLADFFNFGIAPALVLYIWITHEIKALGWAITLFFVISQALRLARFNASIDDDTDKEIKDKFFKGVPAPCGALLSLLPLMLTFMFNEEFGHNLFTITPLMVTAYTALVAVLMVSSIPTISIKTLKIRRDMSSFALAFAGIFIIALILKPWVVLSVLSILYFATIPFSVIAYYRIMRRR
jgi:CDP-diacylglycerol--serine O-phosphatidyltransferase